MQRLLALDGLRGVAAFAVLLHHLLVSIWGEWFAQAYLAVDFFFVLSGFVIARAYEKKFTAGLKLAPYMSRRLTRLYPAIAVGIALAIAVALWQGPSETLWIQAAIQLALLPQIGGGAFPLNPPQWSLFCEISANFLHAALFRWLSNRILAGIVIVSAAALIVIAVMKGSLHGGELMSTMYIGAARVGFSFFVGVGIFRLSGQFRAPIAIPFPLAAIIVFAICALPWADFASPAVVDLLVVGLAWPVLVLLVIGGRDPRKLAAFADISGRLSYPLYAVHWPIFILLADAINAPEADDLTRLTAVASAVALSIAAAWIVEAFVERFVTPGPRNVRGSRIPKMTSAT